MRKTLIGIAALAALSAPAAAQEPYDSRYGDEYARDVARALPEPEELQQMAWSVDRLIGALLEVDIAPVLDAADPGRRSQGERTLGEMAGRDDPYFEERLRSNLYGVTAGMGRMMEAFAVVTPVLARSIEQMEREIEAAAEEYRYRR